MWIEINNEKIVPVLTKQDEQNKDYLKWQRAYEVVSQSINEEKEYAINIELFGDMHEDAANLLDLCYLFPLIDYLIQQGKRVEINIKTVVDSGKENKQQVKFGAQERIRALVKAQACRFYSNKNISFQIDGKRIYVERALFAGEQFSEKRIYEFLNNEAKDILRGALQVSEQRSSNGIEKRKILLNHKPSDKEKKEIKNEIEKLAEDKYGTKYEVTIGSIPEISRIAPILSVGMVKEDSSIYLEDLIRVNRSVKQGDNPQLIYLSNACYKLRCYLEDRRHFLGSAQEIIPDSRKAELAGKLKKYMAEKLPSMNLLSTIIWLYILRDLQDSKQLVKFVKDTKDGDYSYLDLELLEKSHLNAVSYAEGLYQLIENACLHSNGKKAYWGMRIYRAELSGGSKTTVERAVINNALYEKYRLCASIEKEAEEDEDAAVGIENCTKIENEESKYTVSPVNIFTKNYSRLLEFYVVDEAMTGKGLLRTTEKHFETIEELIEDSPHVENNNWERFSTDVANHYGLRVFCKIIEGNDGYIIARSPGIDRIGRAKTDTLFRRTNSNIHDEDENRISYTTSFHILAPLLPEWKPPEESKRRMFGVFLEEKHATPYRTVCVKPVLQSGQNRYGTNGKIELVDNLVGKMNNALQPISEKAVLAVDMRESGMVEAELLAKALFKLSISRGREKKTFYVAVLFSENRNEPHEFTRIFASFYDKMADKKAIEGEDQIIRDILGNMQIAICTAKTGRTDAEQELEVNFIISGEDPYLAFQSVKNYLYMNFSSSFCFLPLLRYLANGKSVSDGKKTGRNWFPFDIYLSKRSFLGEKEQICNPWMNCLFLDRMNRFLNTDLQEHTDGCRIPGVHMRIGSKLHLDTFYEAELMFRSIGNIQGFACIIANDILRRQGENRHSKKEERIVVVGYEQYSAELVTQIYSCLEREGWSATACVIRATGNQQKQFELLASCGNYPRQDKDRSLQKAILLTVIPVGSTMSTVYKVRNIAKMHLEKEYEIVEPKENSDEIQDYCIVAVNGELNGKNQKSPHNITWDFWDTTDLSKKIIRIKPEKKRGRALSVRYLLNAAANWSEPIGLGENPNTCKECQRLVELDISDEGPGRLPLLQVDKSSMIPDTIFKLKNSNLRLLPAKDDGNKKRMEKLYGLIRYGHICEADNHYQFYFDLGQLFQANEQEVRKWLASIEIDDSAYNIIISPNNIHAVPFQCAVMEQVFGNSLRFLHLNINQAYREDVRLKFCQVAEEYKRLRREMPNVPFRVYYLADTIASTRTISRAQLLVTMLLNESGLSEVSERFAKIIVLLCRSAYDTMNQFVETPENDVAAWLTLNIPPYNMQADCCPACVLLEKYALLRKRSATKTISARFERLEQKHAKRSVEEYDQWIIEDIRQKHSYYAWFKQWFFFHYHMLLEEHEKYNLSLEQVKNLKSAFAEEFKKVLNQLPCPKDEQDWAMETKLWYLSNKGTEEDDERRNQFRRWMDKRTLKDLAQSSLEVQPRLMDEEKISTDKLAKLIRDTVVAERNYKRLICLQEAYESLILLKTEAGTIEEMNQKLDILTRASILSIISSHLTPQPQSKEEFAENAEWMISFVKVLSRDMLVKYYHVHRAVVNIMYDMLAYINYGAPAVALTKKLVDSDPNWYPILRTLRFNPDGNEECIRSESTVLCASLQYEIFMTLVHRLSVLQCSLVYEEKSINRAIVGLTMISEKYFGIGNYKVVPDELINTLTYTELPPPEVIRTRYIKSVKTATMLTSNDDPCYRMARELRGEHK